MALDLRGNFFSAQYLENKLTDFHLIYICIYIDKILFGIVTPPFWHICTKVMALDLRQKFVSAQYLENKSIDFYQILYMHSY